jgi:hypothetical protein
MARRFGRYKVGFKQPKSIMAVIKKLTYTVIALWVGGLILTAVASAMNGTTTPFAEGLAILGFEHTSGTMDGTVSSTGLLTVIAVIGATNIIMDFLSIKQ